MALSLPSKAPRAMAIMLLEAEREVKRGGKSDTVGNLSQRLVAIGKELASLRQSLRLQILAGRLADLPVKKRGKAGTGKAEAPGNGFQGFALAKILAEIIDRLLDARVPMRIAFPGVGAVAEKQGAFHRVKSP